jgi:hypothetical protein
MKENNYRRSFSKGVILKENDMWYGKGFNGDDSIFIPEGSDVVKDFLPVGKEDDYIEVKDGWIKKSDYEKLKM